MVLPLMRLLILINIISYLARDCESFFHDLSLYRTFLRFSQIVFCGIGQFAEKKATLCALKIRRGGKSLIYQASCTSRSHKES